ncbi:MAG TPA: outer membrane beta-barrel protein [Candidatus Krumholzibacteria bacterium]|nr:outer membrane beta-barrel protein [Candidatus Krumholzibacteria bacterium]
MYKWKLSFTAATVLAVLALVIALLAASAHAEGEGATPWEASILGGVQGLMENDTALPDNFVNIPLAAALAYHAGTIFAIEGEFAWLIPVANTVSTGTGGSQDLKNPDVLSYQANLRAQLPWGAPALSPYLTAGVGAMTFLSATGADNHPQLSESETAFAINFGLGASIPLTQSLALRGDFREFVAFPQDDAAGLSDGTGADPIWMPRGTFGLTYRF